MVLKSCEEALLYLLVFVVLEVKDDLDRSCMKKWIKTAKISMLWNVPPDVLPGSATVVYVLDRLLNGWYAQANPS